MANVRICVRACVRARARALVCERTRVRTCVCVQNMWAGGWGGGGGPACVCLVGCGGGGGGEGETCVSVCGLTCSSGAICILRSSSRACSSFSRCSWYSSTCRVLYSLLSSSFTSDRVSASSLTKDPATRRQTPQSYTLYILSLIYDQLT